jgi:hypothetical protein
MGRGRQKAKQTKVARQLKYFSPETDYDALQRELANGTGGLAAQTYAATDDSEDDEEIDDDDEEIDDDESADDSYADWNPRGRQ